MATVVGVSDASGWDATLGDFERRQKQARAMGDSEKLARRAAEGRLDARQRIAILLDEGSFSEIGTLAGPVPADALVAGVGAIDGRPVAVGAEDFTTMGGSIGPAATRKRWRIADIAGRERIPLIMLLEGAGHRPPMPGDPGGGGPNDLQAQASLSGLVPMVCGVMGPSAGHGAVTALLCDFSIMTPDAAIFTAGPPVVEASMGERVGKEELGGRRGGRRCGNDPQHRRRRCQPAGGDPPVPVALRLLRLGPAPGGRHRRCGAAPHRAHHRSRAPRRAAGL